MKREQRGQRNTFAPGAASPTRSLCSSSCSCEVGPPSTEHEDLHRQCEKVQPTHFSPCLRKTLCSLRDSPGGPALTEDTRPRPVADVIGRPQVHEFQTTERVRPTGRERRRARKEKGDGKYPGDSGSLQSVLCYPAGACPLILLNPNKLQARSSLLSPGK